MLSCNGLLDYSHWWLTTFILLLEFFLYVSHDLVIFLHLNACICLCRLYRCWNFLYHMVEPCFYIWMVVFVSMFILMLRFLYIHHIQGIKKLLSIDLFIITPLLILIVCVLILTCQSDFVVEYGILSVWVHLFQCSLLAFVFDCKLCWTVGLEIVVWKHYYI